MISQKLLNRIATAMLIVVLMSLIAGLLVPVYTDEVAWRFQISRYFQDGGLDRATGETCGANTWAAPAWFMLPVRMFSSTVTAWLSNPLIVRLAGVGFAMLAVFGMRGLVRRQTSEPERRATLEILVLALLGTGVLPFLLVWSRPDQPVLLALVASLLLAFAYGDREASRESVWRIATIAALALIAFSYHIKGVFYLPVFVLAVCAAGRGAGRGAGREVPRYRIRGVALAVMLCAAWSAYRYWSGRFACPDDPLLAAKLQRENVMVLLQDGGWRGLLAALPKVFDNMLPDSYIRIALPSRHYMSDWLPAAPVSPAILYLWRGAAWIAWITAAALTAILLALTVRDARRKRWPVLAAIALGGCATAWAALQINKNAYESSVYIPVLVLALAFLWLAPQHHRSWLRAPVLLIAGMSVVSQVLLVGSYAGPLWAAGRDGGYVAGQPYSLSAFAYPRAQILAAGAKCGIVPHPGLRRVLIDDLSYFAYADSALPMHRLGVLSDWNGSAGYPMIWMRRHGSPGAVLACAYLPPELRARAIATGPICCVSTR